MHYYRKKKKKLRGIFILICLIFLIAAYVFFLSPIFKIRTVEAEGNENISTEEIKNNFNYKNIFLFTQKEIKSDLFKKFPRIADLKIKKDPIKRLVKLTIIERKEIGIICKINPAFTDPSAGEAGATAGKCFYIDSNGVIFGDAPQTSGSLILLIKDYSQKDYKLGDKIFSKEAVDAILEAKEYLSLRINIKISDFSVSSLPADNLKVLTVEGWYIVFSLERDIKNQLLALKAGLDEKIKDRTSLQYIDLRIENRIYYK